MQCQVRMNNERFMVPEILFRPSDIGIQQVRLWRLWRILTESTRWAWLKLLWKVYLPVIQQHNLGCTSKLTFLLPQTRPLELIFNGTGVPRLLSVLQEHFTHRGQHGLPWHGGEASTGGAHPRSWQHAGSLARSDQFKVHKCLKYFISNSVIQVNVRVAPSPALYPWQGGASLAKDPDLPQLCVTKEEYMEKGFQACQHRFYLWFYRK